MYTRNGTLGVFGVSERDKRGRGRNDGRAVRQPEKRVLGGGSPPLHLRRDGTVPLTRNQQTRGGRNAVVRIKTECGYDIVVHRGVGHAETRVPNVKKKRM